MPGYDGRGPLGTGPIGRGFGPCGRGLRQGFGRGLAWRAFEPEVKFTKEDQRKILEAEKTELETEIKEIARKLKELK